MRIDVKTAPSRLIQGIRVLVNDIDMTSRCFCADDQQGYADCFVQVDGRFQLNDTYEAVKQERVLGEVHFDFAPSARALAQRYRYLYWLYDSYEIVKAKLIWFKIRARRGWIAATAPDEPLDPGLVLGLMQPIEMTAAEHEHLATFLETLGRRLRSDDISFIDIKVGRWILPDKPCDGFRTFKSAQTCEIILTYFENRKE